MIKTITTTALLAAGMLLGTGCTAHTDGSAPPHAPTAASQDDAYANMLRSHGVHITSTEHARNFALAACVALQRGQSFDLVTTEAMQANPGDSRDDDRYAITAAEQVYCPGA